VTSVVRPGRTAITGVRESTGRSLRTIIIHIRCGQADRLRPTRIMADLRVADIEATKSFYTDYLALSTEECNVGWVAAKPPDTRANVKLIWSDLLSRGSVGRPSRLLGVGASRLIDHGGGERVVGDARSGPRSMRTGTASKQFMTDGALKCGVRRQTP